MGFLLALGFIAIFASRPSHADSYVFPYLVELEGAVGDTPNTIDSVLTFTWTGGISTPGRDAQVRVFLFDDDGLPAQSDSGADVANPAVLFLSNMRRSVRYSLENAFVEAGGFPSPTFSGFAVVEIAGDQIGIQASLINAVTGPVDLNFEVYQPFEVGVDLPSQLIFPLLLDNSGDTGATAGAIDTTVVATYVRGLINGETPFSATVDLYLFGNDGQLAQDAIGQPVCNPCSWFLDQTTRKVGFPLDEAFAVGGYPSGEFEGFGVLEVGGDADHLQVMVLTRHSRGSPDDLSFLALRPQVGVSDPLVVPRLDWNDADPTTGPNGLNTSLHAVYVAGLVDGATPSSVDLELYLFEPSGALAQTFDNFDICNPCLLTLDSSTRAAVLSLDEILSGSYPDPTFQGFATVVALGDSDSLGLFARTTHSRTSADDLELTGVPVEISPWMVSNPVVVPLVDSQGSGNSSFDSDLFLAYASGLPGALPPPSSVDFDLFLFDHRTGGLLARSATNQVVCNPCSFSLDAGLRSVDLAIEALFLDAGGLPALPFAGFGVIAAEGDTDGLSALGQLLNRKTGPDDTSTARFPMIPLVSSEGEIFSDGFESGDTTAWD